MSCARFPWILPAAARMLCLRTRNGGRRHEQRTAEKIRPATATACCVFFCAAAVVSHGKDVLSYLIVFAAVMALAIPFYRPEAKAQ